jgi:hypothetical protein
MRAQSNLEEKENLLISGYDYAFSNSIALVDDMKYGIDCRSIVSI